MSLEYIVVDGNSTDSTLSRIQEFARYIEKIISEPDEGQYHAICKGFAASTGEIMGWINGDDILMPWTIKVVQRVFQKYPEVQWITGLPSFLSADGQLTRIQSNVAAYPRDFIANGWYNRELGGYLQQESMFWRRELWDRVGGINTRFSLAADFDLWRRFAQFADLVPVGIPLAAFREGHGEQRSSKFATEYEREVAESCHTLPTAPLIWRWLSTKGQVTRSIARLLIRRKTTAIIYSRRSNDWETVSTRRSISRLPLGALMLEFKLSRRYP